MRPQRDLSSDPRPQQSLAARFLATQRVGQRVTAHFFATAAVPVLLVSMSVVSIVVVMPVAYIGRRLALITRPPGLQGSVSAIVSPAWAVIPSGIGLAIHEVEVVGISPSVVE